MKNLQPKYLITKVMTKALFAGGLSILIAPYALAEVTLQVDDNIKVMVINGKEVKQSLLQPVQQTFTLQPGKHVITARYDRMYKLNRDDHDYVKSGNVTVTADMQDNMTYRLAMPGQPERHDDAVRYAKNPTLAVMQGNQVIAQEEGAVRSGGLLSGITSLFGGGSAQQANQQAIAAVDAPAANATTTTSSVPVRNNATTLDKFMQLWLQATPEERAKIRQWVEE